MNNGSLEKDEKEIKGQVIQEIDEQNEQTQHLKENVLELCGRLNGIMTTSEEKPVKENAKDPKTLVPIADCIRSNRHCIQEINELVKDILNNIEL
jgi:hypothetical protein